MYRAAAALALAIACGTTPAAPSAAQLPRCPDGRPQSEIDRAGALPFPLSSPEFVCVANAISDPPGHDRAIRIRDGRILHVYERTAALPSKPTQVPVAAGVVNVRGLSWDWASTGPTLVLELRRPDLYVELDTPIGDPGTDLQLLTGIAATIAVPR